MKKEPEIYLGHILECIIQISKYTKAISIDDFTSSLQIQDAVIRRLEVIGEAVKNLPQDLKDHYPDIEWRKIAGLRDVLIHDYFGVDIGLTWRIVIKELPVLKKKISKIRKELRVL